MAHTKEEIKNRIDKLPIFEKRTIKVSDSTEPEETEWTKQDRKFAICEVGYSEAYSYVTKNYNLVQFKDVFTPLVNCFEDFKGYLIDHRGMAILKIFPNIPELEEENYCLGLMAVNSVDLSTSVIVKFVIKHQQYQITVPAKIAGIQKSHVGDVVNIVKDYVSMVSLVKRAWKTIMIEFPKYRIVSKVTGYETDPVLSFGDAAKNLKLGERMKKRIKKSIESYDANSKRFTLWEMFIFAIEELSEKKYKNDMAREKQLERLSNAIFEYSFTLSL